MSKNLKIGIGIGFLALLLVIGGLWLKSRTLSGKLAEQDAIIKLLHSQNETIQAEANGALDSLNTVIAKRDLEIVSLKKDAAVAHQAVKDKDKELDKIRESWAGLSIECQNKLHELDNEWIGKFNLVNVELASTYETIRKLELNIKDKDVAIGVWEKKFNSESALRVSAELGFADGKAKIKSLQFWGNLGKGGIILAAVIGYAAGKS